MHVMDNDNKQFNDGEDIKSNYCIDNLDYDEKNDLLYAGILGKMYSSNIMAKNYLMNGNYVDGYKLISFDNMLYRYFNIANERYIKGLYNWR